MNILFNIAHPGQVHLFKNAIKILEKNGHNCTITAIEKDVSIQLLNAYNIKYCLVGCAKRSMFSKALELLRIEYNLYKISKKFKPDVLIGGTGNAYVAHVGKLIKKPSITFDDTEHALLQHYLTDPFATLRCTPVAYNKDLGKKQVRYDGYHELAYLHPNYFTPNPAILDELELTKNDTIIVLRFVSWEACHDGGQSGIQNRINFVNELEKYGKVLITSEANLGPEFEKYVIKISPEKMHDLMYYATLYIGEGATMASEAAVLGTPALYVNTLKLGYLNEQESKYGLVYNFSDEKGVLEKAIQLLNTSNLKEESNKKREKLLSDKIDVTKFMVRVIEKEVPNIKGC
ncbi:DUF354 domain-containing protein [Methanococcus maripaludis]|uniref:DUF354 domain-containing protein n=1 Tax=Methanococcus maripaludis TaxID=39152 RepID=A0A7J9PCM4_METMI|nr:DUF354 domain-containing protein [Methanococcus maripaludis]MBA2860466.1 hypothetical protein [Methanococcus maripaludis]